MGATSWSYVVQHRADVGAALRALRDEVFESGKYERPEQLSPDRLRRALEYLTSLSPDKSRAQADRERLEQMIAAGIPQRPTRKPRSIAELIQQCGESATHSILDVERVTPKPAPGAVSPITRDEALMLFGTERPTRAMVESKEEELCDLRERGQGVYVIAYDGDRPNAIMFAGHSGD